MTRKIALALFGLIAAASMLLVVTTPQDAQAQCTIRDYNGNIVNATGCLEYDLVRPTPTPTPRPTPQPTSSAVVSADTVAATTSASGGASIAFTGAESRVLGYIGASMIGAGALAVAVSRRRYNDENTPLD